MMERERSSAPSWLRSTRKAQELKAIINDRTTIEEVDAAMLALQKLPRDGA